MTPRVPPSDVPIGSQLLSKNSKVRQGGPPSDYEPALAGFYRKYRLPGSLEEVISSKDAGDRSLQNATLVAGRIVMNSFLTYSDKNPEIVELDESTGVISFVSEGVIMPRACWSPKARALVYSRDKYGGDDVFIRFRDASGQWGAEKDLVTLTPV